MAVFIDHEKLYPSLMELKEFFESKGFTSPECVSLCINYILIESSILSLEANKFINEKKKYGT